jgi:DNA-binding beta-propeller fold protein YncE
MKSLYGSGALQESKSSRTLESARALSSRPLLPLAMALLVVGAAFAAAAPQERAETRYFDAESVLLAGDVEGAMAAFTALIDDYPPARFPALTWRAAAAVRVGELQLQLGRADAGEARFVAVLDGEPPSAWWARARLGLARSLMWRGEWPAATDLLQSVVDAVEAGTDDADPIAAGLAREHLGLAHRLWVRPAAGEAPWRQSGRLPIGGELGNPIGVAAAPGFGILVVDEGTDLVTLIDPAGPPVSATVRDAARPWWGPAGEALVAADEWVNGPFGLEAHQFAFAEGDRRRPLNDLRAGARTATGDWILLDEGFKQVMVFSSGGDYLRSLDLGPDGEPVDVALGPQGKVYVIEKRRREVRVFNPDGSLFTGFGYERWREPYALAVDAAGFVYLLDRGNRQIEVFDPELGAGWTLGPVLPGGVELRDPRDIAVDGAGRVLIADRRLSAIIVIE